MKTTFSIEINNQVKASVYSDRYTMNQLRVYNTQQLQYSNNINNTKNIVRNVQMIFGGQITHFIPHKQSSYARAPITANRSSPERLIV